MPLHHRQKEEMTCNEVRHKPLVFWIFVIGLSAFALGIIIIIQKDFIAILPLLMLTFVILTYVNVKMIYDGNGVTFYDMRSRSCFASRYEIVSVEGTLSDPRLSRGGPGRIVLIVYHNRNGRTESVQYGFSDYVGLPEFLAFTICHICKP